MQHRTHRFKGAAGREIFTQCWLPDDPHQRAVVLAHGLGEHSSRYRALATHLVGDGWSVYAIDHHGHGRSAGPRANIERFAFVLEDLDEIVKEARLSASNGPVVLLGHSMGGAIALAYALKHGARLDGLALSGAALALGQPVSRLQLLLVRGLSAMLPNFGVLALPPTAVSRDPEVVRAYVADPLVFHGRVPARTLAELTATMDSFIGRVGALRLPVLVQHGTADSLVEFEAVRPVYERIGSPDCTILTYDGLYHEVFNEPERERVIADLASWLKAHFD